MKVADTMLCEGSTYWGLLRIDNLSRQCVRISGQHSQTNAWVPVAEFVVINGKLAFTVYGKSQNTGTKGEIEGGDANEPDDDGTSVQEGPGKIITP